MNRHKDTQFFYTNSVNPQLAIVCAFKSLLKTYHVFYNYGPGMHIFALAQ